MNHTNGEHYLCAIYLVVCTFTVGFSKSRDVEWVVYICIYVLDEW